jgi:hypothetical protein
LAELFFRNKVLSMLNKLAGTYACSIVLWVAYAGIGMAAGEAGLEIELNKIEQTDAGCRLTFKSTNFLNVRLDSFSMEVYLLDPRGVALQSVQFSFGPIAASKARFAKFDLRDRTCAEIGGIFVNEFKSCKADVDISEQCRDTLKIRNLTTVKFSDGAE